MNRNTTQFNESRNEKSEEQMRAEGRKILRARTNYQPLRPTKKGGQQKTLDQI